MTGVQTCALPICLIAATLLGLLVALVFVRRLNVPDVLRTGE